MTVVLLLAALAVSIASLGWRRDTDPTDQEDDMTKPSAAARRAGGTR